ncbi:serine dehydratase subunit alpha family protein [Sporosalibacterium faouarense]|uniref:L-cysteine desulfidase family protein n=1 Tax=Sporosalibacterium faouarense TaxID=516123 RepID=UPI00141CD4D3|nr:L-serine ammonia-lyase, iron-sulfur-dependent, subunit alpha [Sporosalibacterium faouarense]MTI49278.1 serine dehydratase subunit alpha family protein [Bacillota bacterium]
MGLENLIIQTLKSEVVPAMGCTEPVAVALACAKCRELVVDDVIDKIEIFVSPNIYKNGLSVGIPSTDKVGLHIASALGIVGGESRKELRILDGIEENDVYRAEKLLESGKLKLDIKNTNEKIYIEVKIKTNKGIARTIIKEKHNKFFYIEKYGDVILEMKDEVDCSCDNDQLYNLEIGQIINTIEGIPFEKIEFMLEGLEMNEKIAQAGLKEKAGMGVGYSFYKNMKDGILSYDLMNCAMMLTAAASDARMSGVSMPVMSSNGSGNNGLTTILPIAAYRKKYHVTDEKLARALAISHIINSYIKYYIDRLSAICGCGVAAGTGAAVAIAWLMGADESQIDGVIMNMIGNTSGMICDGAKPGCALKLATSASTAIQSALLALSDSVIPSRNGIVGDSAEETIRNLRVLSVEGMSITDQVILKIMKNMNDKSKVEIGSKKSNYSNLSAIAK